MPQCVGQFHHKSLPHTVSECTTESSVQVNEDKLYELIQDVKVELEESENHFIDDLNDEDYGKGLYLLIYTLIRIHYPSIYIPGWYPPKGALTTSGVKVRCWHMLYLRVALGVHLPSHWPLSLWWKLICYPGYRVTVTSKSPQFTFPRWKKVISK